MMKLLNWIVKVIAQMRRHDMSPLRAYLSCGAAGPCNQLSGAAKSLVGVEYKTGRCCICHAHYPRSLLFHRRFVLLVLHVLHVLLVL